MFPSVKKKTEKSHAKKRKLSPGASLQRDNSSKRKDPGGRHRDKPSQGWKKSADREKPFGPRAKAGGKTFRAKKFGDTENKFGGKKKGGNKILGNKWKDRSFNVKGQKGKQGFKKRGAEAKQGFKQRKGKR